MYKRRSVRTKRGKRTIYKRKTRKLRRKRSARKRAIRPEVKQQTGNYPYTSYNGVINGAGDFVHCVPAVTIGTGTNQRIGSRINPLKLVVRGYVAYKASSLFDSRMIQCRQFLMRPRTSNCDANFTIGASERKIIDFGGVSEEYDGTVTNHLAPHNKEIWRFYKDRKFTMLKPFGATNQVTPANTSSMSCPNNTLFRPFTFTIKGKNLPSQFMYDDAVSPSSPTNFSLYHAIGYTDLLNNSADVTTTQIAVAFSTTLYYTDP